jgi:hypothetical protein
MGHQQQSGQRTSLGQSVHKEDHFALEGRNCNWCYQMSGPLQGTKLEKRAVRRCCMRGTLLVQEQELEQRVPPGP